MSSHHHCYCPPPPHHCPPPPPDPHLHFHHHQPDPYHFLQPKTQHHSFQPQQEQQTVTNATISSLIRRISALETALAKRSVSTSLRNAAAQIIQTHFRAFLLRRSRTLGQLKDLAFIKSELGFLKMAVAEKTHFDYDVVCRKVRVLLRKLANIQGGDPMIRDGKSVVSRDLNRFLDYIDGFYVERTRVTRYVRGSNSKTRVSNGERDLGNKRGGGLKRVNEEKLRGLAERIDRLAVEIDEEEDETRDDRVVTMRRSGGLKRVNEEKLRGLAERIDKLAVGIDEEEDELSDDCVVTRRGGSGNRSGGLVLEKPVKRVSFVEDGKVYGLVRQNAEPYLDEENCDDSDDGEDFVDEGEIEEIGLSAKDTVDGEEDEFESEEGSSSRSSEGEKDLTSYPRGKR